MKNVEELSLEEAPPKVVPQVIIDIASLAEDDRQDDVVDDVIDLESEDWFGSIEEDPDAATAEAERPAA